MVARVSSRPFSSSARRFEFASVLAIGLLLIGGASTGAQAKSDYPTQNITLIVPFAAGGPTDIVARIIADDMSRTLGQQIIIENVIGSGGTMAVTKAKRSHPDGYTIVMGHMGTHAAAVALYPNLAYDPIRDFEPIGMVVSISVLVLARKDLPPKNLEEFFQYLKTNGDSVNMAHAGVGSVSFTSCLLLSSLAGARSKLTSFQGTGPAMKALIAGHVDYMCDQVISSVPQVAAGNVKAYAVTTARRNPMLPDVPTSAEAGVPAFQISAWNALFAPKNTPRAVIEVLNEALGKALENPDVMKQLADLGGEIPSPEQRTPPALADLVKSEIDRWTLAIHATNSGQ